MKIKLYENLKNNIQISCMLMGYEFKRVTTLYFQPLISFYNIIKIMSAIKTVKINRNNDLFVEFENNVITKNNNIVTYSKGVSIRDTGIRISDNPELDTLSLIKDDLNILELLDKDSEIIFKYQPDLEHKHELIFNNAYKILNTIDKKECGCTIKE
jgi:hypothetical protein